MIRIVPCSTIAALLVSLTLFGSSGVVPAAHGAGAADDRAAAHIRRVTPHAPAKNVFGPDSQWRLSVRHARVAKTSSGLVTNLANQVAVRYAGVAAFNVYQYAVSAYTVTNRVKRQRVTWDNCQGKPYRPPQLYGATDGAVFESVPVPGSAIPSPGSDGELSVYDRSSDQLWELWKANHQVDGWHACWGGRIDHVSRAKGYYSDGTGVAASGLSSLGGAIRISEVRQGRITHAMSLNVVDAAHWSDYSFPAQRSDGAEPLGTPGAIQEGRRFRLNPSVRISQLNLSPVAEMIARAAKRYGFIVNDKGGAVAVIAESGAASAGAGRVNPWSLLLAGQPSYDIMRAFPWGDLQALPRNYGLKQAHDQQ